MVGKTDTTLNPERQCHKSRGSSGIYAICRKLMIKIDPSKMMGPFECFPESGWRKACIFFKIFR